MRKAGRGYGHRACIPAARPQRGVEAQTVARPDGTGATTLGVERETVRVFIVELEPENWGIAGVPASLIRGRAVPGDEEHETKA